ncbi:MAG: peptidoglycan-binding domain-containing protein, partial [Patescibacteria group bacterium]
MSNLLSLKSKYLFGVMMVVASVVAFAIFATSALAYTHSVTLKQGSTGAQVMELQKALSLTADGKFGPMTKAAVMAFQSSKGLVADGIVGAKTGVALGGSVSGNFPAGCTSASGYSSTTGVKCD